MRGMFAVAKAALVSATLLGRLTGRVASSMTMVSKPRLWPSMAPEQVDSGGRGRGGEEEDEG